MRLHRNTGKSNLCPVRLMIFSMHQDSGNNGVYKFGYLGSMVVLVQMWKLTQLFNQLVTENIWFEDLVWKAKSISGKTRVQVFDLYGGNIEK